MTKGIREFTNATFTNTLPKLAEWGAVTFRRSVMEAVRNQFEGLSVASAATHYNHALKLAKVNTPALVEGLGRPEDKKGGRKPLYVYTVVKAKSRTEVVAGISRAKADELVAASQAKGKVKLAVLEDLVAQDEADAAEAVAA